MADLLSIRYGAERLTRAETATRVLTRLLQRLPASLWETDPADPTIQRELMRAFAHPVALALENQTIARQMTLLLEAEGVDLDTLLTDYGLRRYLQRPDAFARQVGMHLLNIPKGTTHAVRVVADLLFDLPHVTLDTGLNQAHVFVADTHPVTTPYTYWSLVSQDGQWYSVTIDHGLPVVSTFPPPGLNTAPAGATLAWFQVRDQTQVPWYVIIEADTLAITETPPTWGTGTTEPFRVLDGAQGLWELRVDRDVPRLETVPITGPEAQGYWRFASTDSAVVYALYVDAEVLVLSEVFPPGRDETPTMDPLDWVTVLDETQMPWYAYAAGGTLSLAHVPPPGQGTAAPFQVLDGRGNRWEAVVAAGPEALALALLAPVAAFATLLDPGHVFETVQLVNESAMPWWLSIVGGIPQLSDTAPSGAVDVTPAGGPYRWLRLYDLAGTLWYGYPTTTLGLFDVSTTSPEGLGTAAVQTLGDDAGVRWHVGIDPAGTFAVSDTPRRSFDGLSTALVLTDAQEHTWFWRLEGSLPFFEVSDVLWPDSVAQTPWGQISWLAMRSEVGEVRYVFPEVGTGHPSVADGPPLGAPWGWSDPVLLYDATGQPWALEVESGDILVYTSQLPDNIPPPQPPLSLRETQDAFAHVQSAGSLVTVLVA
jgi:hypothetical protein